MNARRLGRTTSGVTLIALLAIAVVLSAALSGAAVSHSHATGEVGLYNEDCSLALLATLAPSALLVQALSAAPLVIVTVAIAPFSVTHRLGASLRLADVRAPPVR
ncbi:MAG: hypothetical protein ACRELS_18440 [Candidatus Rokuibacteriota bacterium]